ncbi:hypothetical protein [Leisingera sp. McT4-56]|nr:hypothetical protein [Leisingera sp. McT4-56]
MPKSTGAVEIAAAMSLFNLNGRNPAAAARALAIIPIAMKCLW